MLKTRIEDQILIAQLDDGATNAVTLNTLKTLKSAIDQVNDQDELKGMILTGTGRFFSSGFDLRLFAGFPNGDAVVEFFEFEEQVLQDLFTCKKPVISAINGHCAAMGLIMSMAADYRLVSDHPKLKLGMSEIKIGLALSLAQEAVVRFGIADDLRYRDLMYFGEMVNGGLAQEKKIVDECLAADALLPRAKEVIGLWIDTPNRPFIQLKAGLRRDTAEKIRRELATGAWKAPLADILMNPEVKATLDFVHSTMVAPK